MIRRIAIWIVSGLALISTFNFSCSEKNVSDIFMPEVEVEPGNNEERIFITDKTGKRWDVTHAWKKYGLDPAQFQFGSGPFAIPPILNPQFVDSEDPGYPDPGGTFLVIGFEMFGDARAYPLSILDNFEVANDRFGDAHVAVGY